MYTIITIEQLMDLSAYSTREDIKVEDINGCLPKLFTKCSNLSNAINVTHNCGTVVLLDKLGNVVKKECIGEWGYPNAE